MAEGTIEGGVPGAATTVGRIAARIDRLPLTRVQWEIALLVELAWGLIIVGTDGIASRLYPFIWAPHHYVTVGQYAVIDAFEVGLGVLIGDVVMSFVADRWGRRVAIVGAALLAGLFLWPFAWVHSFVPLLILSIFSTLGVGAIVATQSVYLSELIGPNARNTLMLGAQSITALVGVVGGLLGYLLVPVHWQLYVYVWAALALVVLTPLLAWRLPESPRWLEAHGRSEEAERICRQLEIRCEKALGRSLPDPEPSRHPVVLATHHGIGQYIELARDRRYRSRWLVLLIAWLFGYPGIVYGYGAFFGAYAVSHGASAQFVFAVLTAAGIATFFAYVANAALRERFERSDVVVVLALLFTLAWLGVFFFPNPAGMAVFYVVGAVAAGPWLFNMYNYTAVAFPTRVRSIAFGAADGLGHIGALIGVSLLGSLYLVGPNHLGWILAITLAGAILPSLVVRAGRVPPREAILEEVST